MRERILALASAVVISFSMLFTAFAETTEATVIPDGGKDVSSAVIAVIAAAAVIVAAGIVVAAKKKD